jgi:hypothetical protein
MLVENLGLLTSGAKAPWFDAANVRAKALTPEALRLQQAFERGL